MEPSSREYWIKSKDTRVLQLRLPSDLATPLPRETIHPIYDKEIAALSNILAFFKAAQNAQRPIYALPDDVLLDIFLYADRCTMPPPPPQAGHMTPPPRVSMAMVCSQVCLRWRILALGSKSLWTIIDFASSGPAWVAERLARACLADLVVRVVHQSEHLTLEDTRRFTAFVSAVVPEHKHISSLELCADTPQVTELVQRLLPSCGALAGLRRLSIHPVRRSSTTPSDESTLLSVVASWLSGPTIPQLQEASLSCAVAFESSSRLWDVLPSHLTSLCLQQDRRTINLFRGGYPGFPDLLSFLRRSTGLQTLVLHFAVPIPTENRPVLLKPIPLLHLLRLEIVETPRLCDYLLQSIRYSDHCSIAVETEGGERNRYAPVLPVVAVARHRSSLSLEVVTRIESGSGVQQARVRLWSLLQTHVNQGHVVPWQDWKFSWRNSHGAPHNLIRPLLDVHPLTDIYHLSLRGAMPLSVPEWIARLSKPTVIENLVIHTSNEYNICVALGCPIAVSSEDQTPTGVLLPSLARLELHACDLNRFFRATSAECGAPDENQSLSWYLLHAMRARVEAGAVPRQFVLTNCYGVKESWVDEMKAAVPEEMRREWDLDAWLGKARAL